MRVAAEMCSGESAARERGADGGVSVGARRGGHARGEGRHGEVVIDEQHESRVDGGTDGCRGVPRARQRQRDVGVGVSAEGHRSPVSSVHPMRCSVAGDASCRRGSSAAKPVRAARRRSMAPACGGSAGHHLPGAPDGGVGGVDALGVPEPRDDLGERTLDEVAGAAPPVEQLVVLDVGDVGVHDPQRHPGGGVGRCLRGRASPPGREGLDLEGVEGRAARVALAAEQPAGDVGVDRLGLHAESGGGLRGGEAGEGRCHLDPINVDAFDVMFAH